MREEFINYPPRAGSPFFAVELAGTSYCDGSYGIRREKPTQVVTEYILRGEGTIRVDGKTYRAKQGDIYLLPPGMPHSYASDAEDPWEKIWFNASGTLVPVLLHEYNPEGIVLFADAGGRDFFERIHAIGVDEAYSSAQKHEKAALVFHELLQHLYTHFYGRERTYARETAVMKAYIDSHFTENITLEALGEMVWLSRSQVVRTFKRDVGKTPYEYCLQLKLDHAKTLLRNTGLRVKEISAMLGFCDEHYFSYIFRTKTGNTPLEYRKKRK